jgi:hypothetical protein
MSDDDEFTFNPDEDEDELETDTDTDDDEFDDDELDEEARLAEAKEIARLRWEIDQLKEVHLTLREHYRQEMRSLIEPLVDKHRELKDDNRQLHANLEAAIKARDGADYEIKNDISSLRSAHETLGARSDHLEEDNRLGRRLQAELNDADAKIAKLEAEIAEIERDCRKLEHTLAERDREHEAIRQETAQTVARGQEWQQRYDQALLDNAAEIVMYQEQIAETTEQSSILEMRAQEFHQMDHLLPELHASLRAEKATIDGIESLLFPRPQSPEPEPAPEPVLAAVGAGGGDGPSDPKETVGTPAAWGDPEPQGTDDAVMLTDEAAPDALVTSDEAFADTSDEGDPSGMDDLLAEPLPDEETGGEAGAYQDLAQDLSWPGGADAGLEKGDLALGDAFQIADSGLTDDVAAWQAEAAADAGPSYGWDAAPPSFDIDIEDPTATAQRRRDELLAYGMPAGDADFDADQAARRQRIAAQLGTDPTHAGDEGAWQEAEAEAWDQAPQAEPDELAAPSGYGVAIPDLDAPPIGAVGIPSFDDPADDSASP